MNNKAVSPVIGVILMVAITVILAAAIGSSVFGQGTAQPAPQANLNIEADGITDGLATIKIEHLGGDPINFSKSKVVASVNGGNSQTVAADLGTISIGDIKKLALRNAESTADPKAPIVDNSVNPADAVAYGDIINIKVIDEATNQLICDRDIRF